jgi:hypothetical protein
MWATSPFIGIDRIQALVCRGRWKSPVPKCEGPGAPHLWFRNLEGPGPPAAETDPLTEPTAIGTTEQLGATSDYGFGLPDEAVADSRARETM